MADFIVIPRYELDQHQAVKSELLSLVEQMQEVADEYSLLPKVGQSDAIIKLLASQGIPHRAIKPSSL